MRNIEIKPHWILLAFIVSFCINIVILFDGCKNTSSPAPAPQPIVVKDVPLSISGDIVQMYIGEGISFVVYENGVAECFKTGIELPFLTKWDSAFILQYNLSEMY